MEQVRVRNLLSNMNSVARGETKKLLPSKLKAPITDAVRYPNALLSIFPKEECYAQLGNVAEDLLRLEPSKVTVEAAVVAAKKWEPSLTDAALDKVRKSVTTQPFLDHIIATRKKVDAVARGTLRYDELVSYGSVQGHPDIRTDTQIFEVKLTGMLKENWSSFLLQVFAYGALAPESTDIYLVFPLQELVWHYELKDWSNRTKYRDYLNSVASKRTDQNGLMTAMMAAMLRELYFIGCHAEKKGPLAPALLNIAQVAGKKPMQIFLGNPQGFKLSIADEDLASAAQVMQKTGLNLFVHSPYIINLCATPGTEAAGSLDSLVKNLQYASAIGCKGVVVHVGKSVDKPVKTAIENMRKNLLTALEHATPECPILLETPAGQGTETLTTYTAFVEFVLLIKDPRLRVCVDTCHVFACGHQPIDYISRLSHYNKKLVKLIHYNDSATPCGSRLDRHAYMGTGEIGLQKMTEIAEHCHKHKFPMVIE